MYIYFIDNVRDVFSKCRIIYNRYLFKKTRNVSIGHVWPSFQLLFFKSSDVQQDSMPDGQREFDMTTLTPR
jgi:hypothetical protein